MAEYLVFVLVFILVSFALDLHIILADLCYSLTFIMLNIDEIYRLGY